MQILTETQQNPVAILVKLNLTKIVPSEPTALTHHNDSLFSVNLWRQAKTVNLSVLNDMD